MVKSCCAVGCTNRLIKGTSVRFFRLPRGKEKREQWLLAIGRTERGSSKLWDPSTENWLCSEHFITGQPARDESHPDYVPSVFQTRRKKSKKGLRLTHSPQNKSKNDNLFPFLQAKEEGAELEACEALYKILPGRIDYPYEEVEESLTDLPKMGFKKRLPVQSSFVCLKCNRFFPTECDLADHSSKAHPTLPLPSLRHKDRGLPCDTLEPSRLHRTSCRRRKQFLGGCVLEEMAPGEPTPEGGFLPHTQPDWQQQQIAAEGRSAPNIGPRTEILAPVWIMKYPWITFDPFKGTMFCQTCRLTYIPESPRVIKDEAIRTKYHQDLFVLGTAEVRMEALAQHVESVGHKIAQLHLENDQIPFKANIVVKHSDKVTEETSTQSSRKLLLDVQGLRSPTSPWSALADPPSDSRPVLISSKAPVSGDRGLGPFGGVDSSLESAVTVSEKVQPDMEFEMLLRNAHAIVKNCRPLADFGWMAKLDEMKGIQYQSNRWTEAHCRKCIKSIAQSISEEFKSRLREAKFASILYDAYADTSENEQEVLVYVQFAIEGVVYTYFVMKAVVDKTKSASICSTFEKLFEILGEDFKKKVVAIAIDGISTDEVVIKDAIDSLKKDHLKYAVSSRCLLHRLELRLREAIKCPLFESVEQMLDSLYAVYQRRPFRNLTKCLGKDPPPNFPLKIRSSYWVSDVLSALTDLWKIYRYVVAHLRQVPSSKRTSKMKVLFKLLRSKSVIGHAHLLMDVLTPLSKLASMLKKDGLTIAKFFNQLDRTIEQLDQLNEERGSFSKRFQKRKTFHGWTLCGSFDLPEDATTSRLKDHLRSHYKNLFELAKTEILDLAYWPNNWPRQNFGSSDLDSHIARWEEALRANDLRVEAIKDEWNRLKSALSRDRAFRRTNWYAINSRHKFEFSNLLSLVDLILSLPNGYTECSRGLDCIHTIERDYADSSVEEQSDLLKVMIHSPSIESFNPAHAVSCFKNSCFDLEEDQELDGSLTDEEVEFPLYESDGSSISSELEDDPSSPCLSEEGSSKDENSHYRKLLENL